MEHTLGSAVSIHYNNSFLVLALAFDDLREVSQLILYFQWCKHQSHWDWKGIQNCGSHSLLDSSWSERGRYGLYVSPGNHPWLMTSLCLSKDILLASWPVWKQLQSFWTAIFIVIAISFSIGTKDNFGGKVQGSFFVSQISRPRGFLWKHQSQWLLLCLPPCQSWIDRPLPPSSDIAMGPRVGSWSKHSQSHSYREVRSMDSGREQPIIS